MDTMTSLNRKRQIAMKLYNEMVELQLNMIDEAVSYSDFKTAMEIITDIKEKTKNDPNARR
jgi:chromosomal replication initiation ATPase DnaA